MRLRDMAAPQNYCGYCAARTENHHRITQPASRTAPDLGLSDGVVDGLGAIDHVVHCAAVAGTPSDRDRFPLRMGAQPVHTGSMLGVVRRNVCPRAAGAR